MENSYNFQFLLIVEDRTLVNLFKFEQKIKTLDLKNVYRTLYQASR